MMHLLPLRNRIIGRLDFDLVSPLHIGSGEPGARREFLRAGENLVIPASSIKGSFRRVAERLQKSVQTDEPPSAFFEIGEGKLELKDVEKAIEWFIGSVGGKEDLALLRSLGYHDELQDVKEENLRDYLRSLREKKPKLLERMARDYATVHHPLYRLFGGEKIASKIRFLDVMLDRRRVKLMTKPGVAIDRKSGRAMEHHLAFFEAVEPTRISIWFIADNVLPGEDEARLLAGVLGAVREMSISLGARKTAGMGRLELREGSFWIIDFRKGEEVTLANPFKGEKNFEEIISYLLGSP